MRKKVEKKIKSFFIEGAWSNKYIFFKNSLLKLLIDVLNIYVNICNICICNIYKYIFYIYRKDKIMEPGQKICFTISKF